MTKKARIPGGTFFDDSCEDLPLWSGGGISSPEPAGAGRSADRRSPLARTPPGWCGAYGVGTV